MEDQCRQTGRPCPCSASATTKLNVEGQFVTVCLIAVELLVHEVNDVMKTNVSP